MRAILTPNADGEICLGVLADCPLGQVVCAQTERFRVAVLHTEFGLIAIKDHCPHADLPLARGHRDGAVLHCPAHNWQFDLQTAQCVHGGPAECGLRTFPVAVRDEKIWVKVRNS